MVAEAEATAATEAFVADVRRAFGSKLRNVILFGSAARGQLGQDSDVDVLVVVDLPADVARDALYDLAFPYLLERDVIIDAKAVRPEQWSRMQAEGRRFALNVLREGRVLA